MTPTRFRECLALLRWSQRGLAEALNRDEGLVRMMARGTRPIPDDLGEWLETLAAVHAAHPAPELMDGRKGPINGWWCRTKKGQRPSKSLIPGQTHKRRLTGGMLRRTPPQADHAG